MTEHAHMHAYCMLWLKLHKNVSGINKTVLTLKQKLV